MDLSTTLLPAILALTAAGLFGFNVHIQRIGLDDTDAMTGALLSVGTTAVMFWVLAPFVVEKAWFSSVGALIFLATGLFFPALGQTLQIASVIRVGPALTSAIGAFTPLFAVSIALALLGEHVSLQALFGLLMMMAALVIATLSPKGIPRGWPVWFLIIPLGAAMVRGVVQPITKFGFGFVPSPFFAALMAASMSTVVLAIMWTSQRKKHRYARRGISYFGLSGAINGMGIFALNSAIGHGHIMLVSPLAATAPLWALLFGALVFRREHLRPKHFAVAILSVCGGALILTR